MLVLLHALTSVVTCTADHWIYTSTPSRPAGPGSLGPPLALALQTALSPPDHQLLSRLPHGPPPQTFIYMRHKRARSSHYAKLSVRSGLRLAPPATSIHLVDQAGRSDGFESAATATRFAACCRRSSALYHCKSITEEKWGGANGSQFSVGWAASRARKKGPLRTDLDARGNTFLEAFDRFVAQ